MWDSRELNPSLWIFSPAYNNHLYENPKIYRLFPHPPEVVVPLTQCPDIVTQSYSSCVLWVEKDSNLRPHAYQACVLNQLNYLPSLVAIHDLQPRFDCRLKLQRCRLFTLHGRGYLPGRFSTFPIGSVCGHRRVSNP